MKNIFTEHPRAINESYWQHAMYAGCMGLILFYLAIISWIHAICPFLFPFTVSRHLHDLSRQANSRWELFNQQSSIKKPLSGDRHDDF